MYNFDPYNVLFAIATNIPVLLMTAFVLQAHINVCYSKPSLSPKSKKYEEEHECVTNQVLLLSKKSTRKRCSLASCVICSPSFSTSPGGTGIGTPRWNTPSRGILGSMICGKDITRLKMRREDCSGPCWTHTATSVTVEGTVYTGAASQSGTARRVH